MLGEGGSGETWLSIDLATNEKVAIKFLKRPIPRLMLPMVMHEIKVRLVSGLLEVGTVGGLLH